MKKPIPFRLFTRRSTGHEKGAILPLVAMGAASLVGVMGLSLDVGNVFVARQELRSAAEAASLAGGTYLTEGTSLPNFTLARANAQASLAKLNNESNGQVVVSASVRTGGYDTSGAKSGLQVPFVPGGTQVPAVEVTMVKNGANGVVDTFFSKVLGIKSFKPTASAIAIGNYAPASAAPGQVLPLAVSQSLMDNLWDPITHQPLVNKGSSTTLYKNGKSGSAPVTKPGEPYRVRIWDNSCNLDVPQTLPSSGKKLTDSEDDHDEHHDDDHDYPVAGSWHTYEEDDDHICSNDYDDCPIKNKTELKTVSYGSDHHELHMCGQSSESRVREHVVSACKGGKYAGFVAVVDRCSHSGTIGKINAFAAVNIVSSGKEYFEKNKEGKSVNCDYVDIQLVAPGQREARASGDEHDHDDEHEGDHEDDDHGLTNAKEFSCHLEGKGVAENSYVTAHPKVVD